MKTFLSVLLWCAALARINGGVLLSESFTYANGVLTNESAGKWRHVSGGFSEVNVEAERVELTGAESEDVEASLSVSQSSSSAAIIYSRFSLVVLQPPTDANGGYFAGVSGRARVFAMKGTKSGTFRLGLANGSSAASCVWPVDLLANQPYTVMTRLAVSNAQATLWVNPIFQTNISISATDIVSAASASAFRLRQDDEIGWLAVDDLVVATSFEEALAGNESPAISGLIDRTIASGASTAPIPFVIGDAETPVEALMVFAQAADSNLVQSISFDGVDSNRTVTVTAFPNRSGTTPVTVFVTDGTTTNSSSFVLTILPALILSDEFLYADGALITNAAPTWVHHGGTNFGEIQVVGGRIVLSVPQTEDVSALLPYGPFAANSGLMLYASFRVNFSQRPGTSGDYFAHFNATGARCRVFANTLNAAQGKYRLGLANGASDMSQQLATDLATNTNHLVVVRYNPATATSTLWVNPTNETSLGTNATDVASASTISMFAFRQSASIGTFTIDDLRVGLSFAGVMGAGPCLRIERVDEFTVRLAWPASATGFVLQSRAALTSQWEDVLQLPVLEENEMIVIDSPPSSPVFYRLRKL